MPVMRITLRNMKRNKYNISDYYTLQNFFLNILQQVYSSHVCNVFMGSL